MHEQTDLHDAHWRRVERSRKLGIMEGMLTQMDRLQAMQQEVLQQMNRLQEMQEHLTQLLREI